MPATKPTTITPRVPTSIWLKTSWPEVRGAEPVLATTAAAGWSSLRAFGSYGAIHGPMIAMRQKNAEDRRGRSTAFALRRKQEPRACPWPAGVVGVAASRPPGCLRRCSRCRSVMSALLSGARVEHAVDEVGHDVGDQHGERDDEEACPA